MQYCFYSFLIVWFCSCHCAAAACDFPSRGSLKCFVSPSPQVSEHYHIQKPILHLHHKGLKAACYFILFFFLSFLKAACLCVRDSCLDVDGRKVWRGGRFPQHEVMNPWLATLPPPHWPSHYNSINRRPGGLACHQREWKHMQNEMQPGGTESSRQSLSVSESDSGKLSDMFNGKKY